MDMDDVGRRRRSVLLMVNGSEEVWRARGSRSGSKADFVAFRSLLVGSNALCDPLTCTSRQGQSSRTNQEGWVGSVA